MKVLIFLPSLEVGGAEQQAVLIANNMAFEGHEVSLVIFKDGGRLIDKLDQTRITLVVLPISGPISAFFALSKLVSICPGYNPTVIYSMLPPANLMAGILGLFRKNLRIIWGIRSSIFSTKVYSMKVQALYWLETKLMWMANGIITNSVAGRQKIPDRHFRPGRVLTVPNGVDSTQYYPDKAARETLRKQYHLTPDIIAIGTVARLDPIKDQFTFLRAAAKFAAEFDNSKFFIIGDGNPTYKSQIEALIQELQIFNRVVLISSILDINAANNMLDIMTLTSISEGFPNAIGEAMATATPCVATNVGDCEYLVGDPELLCQVGDDRALCAIWRCLADKKLRAKKGHEAYERATQHFSVDKCIQSTTAFLGKF
ncbi:MAG: hypothetical protein CMM73_04145 [Rhodospirillaceae bacterium]|nr:hypothetical protein [Rhodospirillaceae bacterium]|tara:strand:+ start:474 stop:1586 length:1113 start_codon:yes stop_codon:yes gene_type:complete